MLYITDVISATILSILVPLKRGFLASVLQIIALNNTEVLSVEYFCFGGPGCHSQKIFKKDRCKSVQIGAFLATPLQQKIHMNSDFERLIWWHQVIRSDTENRRKVRAVQDRASE